MIVSQSSSFNINLGRIQDVQNEQWKQLVERRESTDSNFLDFLSRQEVIQKIRKFLIWIIFYKFQKKIFLTFLFDFLKPEPFYSIFYKSVDKKGNFLQFSIKFHFSFKIRKRNNWPKQSSDPLSHFSGHRNFYKFFYPKFKKLLKNSL